MFIMVFQVKKVFPFLLAVLFLVLAFVCSMPSVSLLKAPGEEENVSKVISSQPEPSSKDNTSSTAPVVNTNLGEMRAVWVPFMELNMYGGEDLEKRFQEKFDKIIKVSKEHGMNTLIVHVRSHGDAMYPSNIFPWSHLLTGTQGEDPGFDPLTYMVTAAHEAGLQFHAWINPLRVQVNGTPKELCKENPYEKWRNDDDKGNDDWVLDYEKDKYYNPAVPQVRAKIIEGVKEIVANYAVDGIHFDDYFYPTSETEYDKKSYDAYCKQIEEGGSPLSLMDWRKTNINTLISGVYSAIKEINPNVVFGISPQGNISNDNNMGADVATWGGKKGYVDYLCPQIYVNFDHPLLPFDDTIKQWREMVSCEDIKLYAGIGVYKAGSDADDGTWKESNDILKKEIEYSREVGCDGFMLYSWEYLDNPQTEEEIANVMKIINTKE